MARIAELCKSMCEMNSNIMVIMDRFENQIFSLKFWAIKAIASVVQIWHRLIDCDLLGFLTAHIPPNIPSADTIQPAFAVG